MVDARLWGILGLCARAGGLVSGEQSCEMVIKSGQAVLVLLDEDASSNTQKKFCDACSYRSVPMVLVDAGKLGQAIGKPSRMCAALKAGSLAEQALKLLVPV